MRHSSLDLTMNVYTNPSLLDVAGALDALPKLLLAEEACETAANSHPLWDPPQRQKAVLDVFR
jgi:hypothetical protein